MSAPPPGVAACGPQAIGNGADAHDHHRPSAGFRHAAHDEIRDIAKEAPVRHSAFGPFGAGQVGEARKQTSIVEPQRLTAQSLPPRIVVLDPHRAGLGNGLSEFRRHLQDGRIVRAARRQLPENPRPQTGLDGRRDRCRCAALTIKGKETPLIPWKDGDQQAGDHQRQQHRILLAALRAYPVSRPCGRSHAVPHPPSEEFLPS
jgi:hypothetical protein